MLLRKIVSTLAGTALLVCAATAVAQDGKTLRLILPFPPGGGTDALARVIAPKLSRELGTNVIVENRPGASGQIAVSFVKSAPPDGSIVLFTSDHSLVVVPHLNPKAGYEVQRDFVALGQVSRFQLALALSPGTAARSLGDFASYVKSNPDKAMFGLPVIGGFPSTVGVAVAKKFGVPMQAIPFVGSAPMMQNMAGDQIPAGISGVPDFLPLQIAGRLRVVAVTGRRRAAALPDVPTFEELGYSGLAANSWYAFFGPKELPRSFTEKFNQALGRALGDPEVKQRIGELAQELAPTSLEDAAAEMKLAADFWAEAAKSPDFVRP